MAVALRDAALDAAIAADPDDRGAYEVYADWLVERNDPRGEWIHVELALEDRPADADLVARRAELLARHEATWCGALTSSGYWPTRPIGVTWRRGFMNRASITSQYESDEAARVYRELAQLPAVVALRELRVGVACSYGGGGDDDFSLIEALGELPIASLRRLELAADHQISWTHVGDISFANAVLSELESLSIEAGRFTLGKVDLPRLRRLELVTGGLRPHVPASIAAARWPALEELVVYFGTDNYGGECTIADVRPLLAGANLPRVRSLGLANSEFADELVLELVRAPIVPRLDKLDLSQGTLGGDGARAILEHADAFAHLSRLDLGENYLPGELARELHLRLPNAVIDNQKTQETDRRYVSVAE